MSLIEHEVDIHAGRRDGDRRVRVSIFANEMVALALERSGERAPTILLTIEQARQLQQALSELIPLIEQAQSGEAVAEWDGEERRLAS